MTTVEYGRFGAERKDTNTSGPETFAPKRRTQEQVNSAVIAIEGEMREFLRHQASIEQRGRGENEPTPDASADYLNALIRRVSDVSAQEIDRVILELQEVRGMLRNEGDRVIRDVAGYASLSHAAMTAMKVISDSLTQWKSAPVPTAN